MTILSPEGSIGLFEVRTTPVNCPMPSIGEAHHRVPVILVWDVVNIENRHLEQVHNVVYHEFPINWTCLMALQMTLQFITTSEEY